MSILIENMIAALALCPCCKAPQEQVKRGIPNGKAAEVTFCCGSAAFVDAEGVATVGIGCPYPMDDALYDIQKRMPCEVA